MSDYSSNFPQQRPTLNLDFANSGKLDSRISFSRADTPPTYAAPSAVHYWGNEKHLSSENLLPYSSDLSNAAWTKSGVTVPSNNNSSPDGGTAASSVLETATTGSHSFYDDFACVSGDSYTSIVYAKANGRSVMRVAIKATATIAAVDYDLTAVSSTVASGSADSHSITAIGSTGWYKLVLTVTATATGTGRARVYLHDGSSTSYTGDVTKGAYFWGMQASSTGETVLNATSGSIHRSFAPTLKSVANAGDPRFEYSPADGQSVGTPKGLLVESQASNLTKYSDDFSSWGDLSTVVVTSNAGVAPSGQLAADLLVSPSTAAAHYILNSTIAFTSGTTYTASVYVKSAGHRYVQLCGSTSAFGTSPYKWVNYDLEAGTLSANNCSGTITAVGNGYYRITATMTATATTTHSFIMMFADSLSSGFFPTTTGNDYSGFLAYGFQTEVGSAASSLISTSGAAATRAADSCSVADFGYTGGPISITAEANTSDVSSASKILFRYDGGDVYTNYFQGSLLVNYVTAGASTQALQYPSSVTAGTDYKVASRVDTNSINSAANGTAQAADTSAVLPDLAGATLHIGGISGSQCLNGNLKNLKVFSAPLTDTNLTALTS